MITRTLNFSDKKNYDKHVNHPVQTWEWGDFQISQGHTVYRLGVFENEKMVQAYSISFHKIPKTNFSIGTILRGPKVDNDMIQSVTSLAKKENAIFVKFEPNVIGKTYDKEGLENKIPINMDFENFVVSPKVAFYPNSYFIDLTKSEDELLAQMHSKTRYNVRVANRYGVEVKENSTDAGFETYLDLVFETTQRQGFYLHTRKYHRDQWQILKKTDIPHVVHASYQGKVISAFMIFKLNDKLFYPYGASLNIHREVMAPTLLMWEVIKMGKKLGCKTFDMWGSLGPNAKESEQGYGFHRFKQGYGGQLVEFVGTYDLVINPILYKVYNFIDIYRWKLLRFKAKILRK